MIIRHVKIENFRGVKKLDWHVTGRMVCLIGPSDSTKTTVLDAIELALLPRSNIQFTDADFYNGDITATINIEVTAAELPTELLVEPEKFGLHLRGYKAGAIIEDDLLQFFWERQHRNMESHAKFTIAGFSRVGQIIF
jgi:putative ATP-dependent endonuclease of OLD family